MLQRKFYEGMYIFEFLHSLVFISQRWIRWKNYLVDFYHMTTVISIIFIIIIIAVTIITVIIIIVIIIVVITSLSLFLSLLLSLLFCLY